MKKYLGAALMSAALLMGGPAPAAHAVNDDRYDCTATSREGGQFEVFSFNLSKEEANEFKQIWNSQRFKATCSKSG